MQASQNKKQAGQFDRKKIIRQLDKIIERGLEKKERLSVSAWADKYRILSGKGSAERGRWRTDRTPFLREIMDKLSPHDPTRRIVIMKSSQVGVTEATVNWIGYVMHYHPSPFMLLLPTEESRDAWVQQKLHPMIDETPIIREIMHGNRSRDSTNRKDLKEFPGGILFMAGGNSPNSYAQRSARYVVMDDLDRFPAEIGGEGNPVSLARGRCKAFSNYKLLLISTPTIKGASHVEDEYSKSDQREYHVPCPYCQTMQAMKFENLHWDADLTRVVYGCADCGSEIEEHKKPQMIASGEWVANNPGAQVAGYHISALYAPIGLGPSWGELALEWTLAQNDKAKLQSFHNTNLGLPWRDVRKDLHENDIMQRAESYKLRTAPAGCLLLTAGVDTQDNRLAIQIVGHGKDGHIWIVDWLELFGDPGKEDLWQRLTDYLNTPIRNEYGHELMIQATAVDSGGHFTHAVYNYVRQQKIRRPMAIQGAQRRTGPILSPRPSYQDVDWRGRSFKRGVQLWQVGVNTAKHYITQRLASDADADIWGRKIHFSEDLQLDYYRQLTAETLDTVKNRFVVLRGRRNEALDTLVYALAASQHTDLRAHQMKDRDWENLKRRYESEKIEPEIKADSPIIYKQQQKARRSNFRI